MKKSKNYTPPSPVVNAGKDDIQEYPPYPEKEDIYIKYKEEKELDPEDISKIKIAIPDDESFSDIDAEFNDDMTGRDLDIPCSELDDQLEMTGNEDEENNYYSLGGDDKNYLDEDKDDIN